MGAEVVRLNGRGRGKWFSSCFFSAAVKDRTIVARMLAATIVLVQRTSPGKGPLGGLVSIVQDNTFECWFHKYLKQHSRLKGASSNQWWERAQFLPPTLPHSLIFYVWFLWSEKKTFLKRYLKLEGKKKYDLHGLEIADRPGVEKKVCSFVLD